MHTNYFIFPNLFAGQLQFSSWKGSSSICPIAHAITRMAFDISAVASEVFKRIAKVFSTWHHNVDTYDETPLSRFRKAQIDFEQAEKALAYIMQYRFKVTLYLALHDIKNMERFLEESKTQKQAESIAYASFATDLKDIQTFIHQEIRCHEEIMGQTEVNTHISAALREISMFHQNVKSFAKALNKRPSDKKTFSAHAKRFVNRINQQKNYYKWPSTDSFIFSQQRQYLKAQQALTDLESNHRL